MMAGMQAFIAAHRAVIEEPLAPLVPPIAPVRVLHEPPAPAVPPMAPARIRQPRHPPVDREAHEIVMQGAEAEMWHIRDNGGIMPITVNLVALFGAPPNEDELQEHYVYRYGFKPNPIVRLRATRCPSI